jgi:mono/diheme cytochrome c family protein
MSFLRAGTAAGLAIWLCLCGDANAQDVNAGKQIAETRCSNCHVIDKGSYKAVDIVPAFPWIARMPSTTEASLFVFLSTPHAEMPNFVLSRQQIRDVSAYILSLRSTANIP